MAPVKQRIREDDIKTEDKRGLHLDIGQERTSGRQRI